MKRVLSARSIFASLVAPLAVATLLTACEQTSDPAPGTRLPQIEPSATPSPSPAPEASPSPDPVVVAPCAGSLALGTWVGVNTPDTLVFDDQCGYTSSACSANGQVPNVTAASGTLRFNVQQTDVIPGCLPAGTNDCAYSIYAGAGVETLADITCGGNPTATYQRN